MVIALVLRQVNSEEQILQNHQDKQVWRHNLVDKIKEITGYEFQNPKLLEQAFTHCSYLNEHKTSSASYERLEYMGDGVLNFFMAKEHFTMYPDLQPGQLTKLRAANVDNEKLARVALKNNLHMFLLHKKPCLAAQGIVNYPVHSWGLIEAPKALADVVESLVGAIYIDSNSMDATFKIIEKLLQPMITLSNLQTHPVTMLYEICQKNNLKLESRDRWKETGEIEYAVAGEFVGKAKYKAKRVVANNRAAYQAYQKIEAKLRLDLCGYHSSNC